ncbi:ABC transporter substrate-binding protein [Roseibium sp.]|uniref:ABC transporter substrate-binding protein n=1 Tax=Roseibium sp. TaxID=1936156 RepID=UPI003BAE7BE4
MRPESVLLKTIIAGLALGLTWASSAVAAPERVVSVNLCTDQLAMLLARPGQLVSVSHLAADPTVSLMRSETDGLTINHGLAEEIFRLDPDLVVAGKYTTRATVNLLRRLGKRVEEFDPANSFDEIAENTLRMGALLGREEVADRLVRDMHLDLKALQSVQDDVERPVLGSYGSSSYTSGSGTLESDIVDKTGFRHLGDEIGIKGTTRLPLEALILANPDYLMIWKRDLKNRSRAAAVLSHPALDARFGEERRLSADTRYWICGTPLTVDAIRLLRNARAGSKGQ